LDVCHTHIEVRKVQSYSVGKLAERDHLRAPGVDGMVALQLAEQGVHKDIN